MAYQQQAYQQQMMQQQQQQQQQQQPQQQQAMMQPQPVAPPVAAPAAPAKKGALRVLCPCNQLRRWVQTLKHTSIAHHSVVLFVHSSMTTVSSPLNSSSTNSHTDTDRWLSEQVLWQG
jgi:hypothetical protein